MYIILLRSLDFMIACDMNSILHLLLGFHFDSLMQDYSNSSVFYMNSMLHLLLGFYFDGLVQDYSNSSANALELLQSCTKSSIYPFNYWPLHHESWWRDQ